MLKALHTLHGVKVKPNHPNEQASTPVATKRDTLVGSTVTVYPIYILK